MQSFDDPSTTTGSAGVTDETPTPSLDIEGKSVNLQRVPSFSDFMIVYSH
jgi:hypothetical protein